ncbi:MULTISPECIES: head-tail connector protein [Ponticoccus]|uniref:Head-tail connector protein n=1 Tax=Ponticoccus litoralis TaxID=422297 RepID=A0AAW9SU76_9RHOB
MSQLGLEELKRFCQAVGFEDDDALLEDLQGAAEDYVRAHTRRDLDAELPGAWPADCILAVKLLVATWYDDRSAAMPGAVRDLLSRHRDLN